MTSATKHSKVTKAIAIRIIEGKVVAGYAFSLTQIQEKYGVSRTVAREAMRSLEAAGLIKSKRRVGLVVQPDDCWEDMNPTLISWRLKSSKGDEELRHLAELRAAIEPVAVAGAARHATAPERDALLEIYDKLRTAAMEGDQTAFLTADIEYHKLLLAASKNSLFLGLSTVFEASLTGRVERGLMPDHPLEDAVDLHGQVARAVAIGDSNAGFESMMLMLDVAWQELFGE